MDYRTMFKTVVYGLMVNPTKIVVVRLILVLFSVTSRYHQRTSRHVAARPAVSPVTPWVFIAVHLFQQLAIELMGVDLRLKKHILVIKCL